MESQTLDAIASELQKQRSVVNEKATALHSDLWTVEKDLSRIDAALKALSGEATKAGSDGLSPKRPKRTSQMPSAKKSDVIAAIRQVLDKAEVLPAAALKEDVEDLLTKSGFNRFGFAIRWREAMQEPQFVHSSDGLRLLRDAPNGSDLTLVQQPKNGRF